MSQPSLFDVTSQKPPKAKPSPKKKPEQTTQPIEPERPKENVYWLGGKVAVIGSKTSYYKTSTTKKQLPTAFTKAESLECYVQMVETAKGKALGCEPVDVSIDPFWLEILL